jgi:PAS domain S-box-containing protein
VLRLHAVKIDRLKAKANLVRYGRALSISVSAILLRLWLEPYLGNSGFAIFLAAILITAWIGGLGPSLIGQTLILVATGVWFSPASRTFGEQSVLRAILNIVAFYGVGTIVALLSDAYRQARNRERAQREEVLAQREQLRATLTCMGDGVLVADADSRVVLINPVAERLTGWTVEESNGKLLRDVLLICDETSEAPLDDPSEYLQRASPATTGLPLVLINKRGQRIPLALNSSQFRDADGRVVGQVMVMRDETERRHAERILREADRRKDEFLATLAHELRNPLAPICAGLDLMKMPGQDPDSLNEVRAIMERQTKHMVRLIDDLLDVSRITRGRLELRKCPVLLSDVVQNAVEATRPLLEESGHRLEICLPERPILLSADPNRVTQVLSNLLNNAAKYTLPGGRIGLTAELHDRDVTITVSDTGIGIPADKLQFVFEMFAQVNGNAERGHTGLGIGLTLVKRLVELHGGTVAVESSGRNRGCKFQIRLPAAQTALASLSPTEHVTPPQAPSETRRVLVVDDNADALETLARMVRLLGHEVCTAADGVEAVDAVDCFEPDIVLMDLGMPNLNGYEAARQIRGRPDGFKGLLVATTGWGQDEDKRRAREAGFDEHLIKPVDVAVIKRILENSSNVQRKNSDLVRLA